MNTFRHSGTLGDLIYSLSIVKKMDPGKFLVALHNIENCVSQYGYRPDEVATEHQGRLTESDYEWLKPLLKRQSYIDSVGTWVQGDPEPTVDLDRFRGTLFRGFEGNYVQAYHLAFGLPFSMQDLDSAWLEADPVTVAPIVISRTSRYQSPSGEAVWQSLVKQPGVLDNAVFVGNTLEHATFESAVGVTIKHHVVENFLELANMVAGAQMVMANQNFVFSLAMALGRPAVLETIKIKPLQQNECFFPRAGIHYW